MTRNSPFGWDLPAGVTSGMIDDAMGVLDPRCEDCEFEVCPFAYDGDMCPQIGLVRVCGHCGLKIGLVRKAIRKEFIAAGYDDAVFCCSKKCADEENKKFKEFMEEMYRK